MPLRQMLVQALCRYRNHHFPCPHIPFAVNDDIPWNICTDASLSQRPSRDMCAQTRYRNRGTREKCAYRPSLSLEPSLTYKSAVIEYRVSCIQIRHSNRGTRYTAPLLYMSSACLTFTAELVHDVWISCVAYAILFIWYLEYAHIK